MIVKKKHLVLVSYYGIIDQFVHVNKILTTLGYTVHDFPYKYYVDNKDDINVDEMLQTLIGSVQPEYVLWWSFNVSAQALRGIVKASPNVKHLYYNWDDPYNWECADVRYKARFLNTAFISCVETVQRYQNAGTYHTYTLYPGYSPAIHKPFWTTNISVDYDTDISFVLTNLYDSAEYKEQITERKKLVDTIYVGQKIHNYRFAVYGPAFLKDHYPSSYRGEVKYSETNRVFNMSKINLCTHVVGNKKGYLNERVFLIMASGGLLFVDPVPGVENILKNGGNCVHISADRVGSQIKFILDNYSIYDKIKRKGYETVKDCTWDDWGMRMEEHLLRDR